MNREVKLTLIYHPDADPEYLQAMAKKLRELAESYQVTHLPYGTAGFLVEVV